MRKALLITGLIAGFAFAKSALADYVSYSFDPSTGTLTISGSGRVSQPQVEKASGGRSNITNVVFAPDSNITSFGSFAFAGAHLNSITIPDTVVAIGEYAFDNCNLDSVTIPSSVETIDDGAFIRNNLTSVTIPDSVTRIGDYAFEDNNLTSVTIPSSVEDIGWLAFYDNANLSSVVIEGETDVYTGAFAGISDDAMLYCSSTNVSCYYYRNDEDEHEDGDDNSPNIQLFAEDEDGYALLDAKGNPIDYYSSLSEMVAAGRERALAANVNEESPSQNTSGTNVNNSGNNITNSEENINNEETRFYTVEDIAAMVTGHGDNTLSIYFK